MQLYFSNRRLWATLCILCAMLGCVFFILAIALWDFFLAALFCLSITGGLAYMGYTFFSQPEKIFIEVWEGQLRYYPVFSRQPVTLVLKDVKHLQHLGHQLRFILADATVVALHLNYLNAEDIKKLLVFLKYVPSSAKKLI